MNEQTTHHHEHSHHHHYTHPWAFLSDMEKLGDEYLVRRAPWQIPHSWKTAIAKILPILAILIAVLTLPGIIGSALYLFGLSNSMMRWSVNGSINSPYLMVLIQTVITIAISALYFKAFDRLKKRQYAGWVYVFYAGMLAFVANLFAGSVLGAILSFIINMYFIFQAKELYN